MSNEPNENQNASGSGHGNAGGWEPIPQSEGYDGDATAFVHLPPEFMLDGVPLEAPGHGYVPPMIVPLTPLTPAAGTDPAATGQWVVQTPTAAEHVEQPDAQTTAEWTFPDAGEPDPHATGQWNFTEEALPADSGSASTGQWTIPVVTEGADASEESGEYTTSMLAQYASSAPATLPGGAPAPWAVQEPEAAEAPVEERPEEPVAASEELSVEEPSVEEPEPLPAVEDPVPAASTGSSADSEEHPHISYTLRVNGADRPVTESWIGESLLYVLRERLGLAGAKDGCSQGECGACNVQVDGRLVASCLVPAATAAGSEVRTVEGLATDGEPSDVQRALARCGAVQCGYCVPGMAMTVHDLLEGNHAPTELETRQALCGNLCRCSGYRGVLDAVREVVTERDAQAAASAAAAEEARIPHQIPHPHDGGMA
ncbi:2Fe-2S iron-sulfur cluster-binding protein [Streptomyces sp. NPDC026092]|uniref:(2Fe-2S)-binding protein n=1 Tax=Streptomyces sp. NPDC026092 TaxID=3154797 RepID=UPI0033C98962